MLLYVLFNYYIVTLYAITYDIKVFSLVINLKLRIAFFFFNSYQLDEMLEKRGVKVDKVLNFAIDDAILEERITGRWIHPSSGRTYHTKFAPPKVAGVDDVSKTLKLLS